MGSSEGAEASQTEREFRGDLALYDAALNGDWETANTLFFAQNRKKTEAIIIVYGETALHIAVRSGRANNFVRKLVGLMSLQALALRDDAGCTALHHAAAAGNTEAAKVMLENFPDLLYMLDFRGNLPITYAAKCCQKSTLEYLIMVSSPNVENSPFEGKQGISLLVEIIDCEFLDVALDLVNKYPNLARLRVGDGDSGSGSGSESGRSALSVLAERSKVFPSMESFSWWEKLIYHGVPQKQDESKSKSVSGDIEASTSRRSSTSFQIINGVWKHFESMIWKAMEHLVPGVKKIKDKKELHKQALELATYLCREMKMLRKIDYFNMLRDPLFVAARNGISEIIQLIMEMHPTVITSVNSDGRTIIDIAVINRFENIYNLTYSMSGRKYYFTVSGDKNDNLMHMSAIRAPPDRLNLVPGAALQMQRELQWFNEMQRVVPTSFTTSINKDFKTPKMLFTEQHQDLKELGEKWMKSTANACSIAAALIATIVFAAAFTVPGGVNSETGIPAFSGEPAFVLFATTNAFSLFTSITSLMMFLSILTSRYAEADFLHVLPQRLSFGLLSLFISITFMLIAFSAALYLVFHKKLFWFIIPLALFGWWPLASFVLLQFPLLVDVVYSTYGPGIFGKITDRVDY